MRKRIMLDVASSGHENISVSGGYLDNGKKSVRVNIGQYGYIASGLIWKAYKNGAHNQEMKGGPVRAVVKLDDRDNPDDAKPSIHVATILDGTFAGQPLNGDTQVSLDTNGGGILQTIMSPETAGHVVTEGIEDFLTPDIVAELTKEGKAVKLVLLTASMCEELSERLTWVEAMLNTYKGSPTATHPARVSEPEPRTSYEDVDDEMDEADVTWVQR